MATDPKRDKLLRLRSQVSGLLYERTEEINGIVLAMLTRSHIVQVGPAGTGKSLGIRLMTSAVEGATYWERLLTRFTVPEEIFGPVSIKALKEDSFKRVIDGHLPRATFGFADEVFKANSSILNSMLTIMQERLFHNDGAPEKVPLEVLIGASNEIPTDETLSAFYDRFLQRYKVQYIAESSHFVAMLKGPKGFDDFAKNVAVRVTIDELHAAQAEVALVQVPDPVLEGIVSIRQALVNQGIVPSDRRYNEAIRLIQAKAWLQGRDGAIMDDLSILSHVLWTDPQNKGLVSGVVLEVANPLLKKAEEQNDALQAAWSQLQKVQEEKEKTMQAVEVLSKANTAIKKLNEIQKECEKNAMDTSQIEAYIASCDVLKKKIQKDYLGLTA